MVEGIGEDGEVTSGIGGIDDEGDDVDREMADGGSNKGVDVTIGFVGE